MDSEIFVLQDCDVKERTWDAARTVSGALNVTELLSLTLEAQRMKKCIWCILKIRAHRLHAQAVVLEAGKRDRSNGIYPIPMESSLATDWIGEPQHVRAWSMSSNMVGTGWVRAKLQVDCR